MHVDMLKRRTIQVLFILIPLMLLSLILARPWNWFDGGRGLIVPGNLGEADRILLADAYNTVELNRHDSSWSLFGTEEVSPVAVENLLYTASRLEVASIVKYETFEEASETPEGMKRITFFRGDRVLLDCSFVANSGRYLLHPAGSTSAFYVSLPGYPGLDLDRVFSASPDHYRDHLLIDLKPSKISGIEVDRANGESYKFIQDREGNLSCSAANDSTLLPGTEPNELAIRLLFSYFTSIRYEKHSGISAAELVGGDDCCRKLAVVRVSSFDGEHHSLQVFSYRETPDSEPDLFHALVLYNDEQEALFVNYIYLDVLMRDLSHYFGEK